MEIIVTIFYVLLFTYLLWKIRFFRLEKLPRYSIPGVFLIKIAFGIAFGYIYSYHYTSRMTNDSLRYFDDALVLYDLLKESPLDYFKILLGLYSDPAPYENYFHEMNNWIIGFNYDLYNNNRTMIRFNAFVDIFTFGKIYGNMVFMCLFSTVGLTALYKWSEQYFISKRKLLFLAVFLIPSVLFWGSGLLKEGLILFEFGFLFMGLYLITRKQKILAGSILVIIGLLLIAITKLHVLVALLPGLGCYLFIRISKIRYKTLTFLFLHLLFFVGLFNLQHIHEDFHVLRKLHLKQQGFVKIAEYWKAGSAIEITPLEANVPSFIKNTPEALTHLIFRPHIFEADKALLLFPAIENASILFFIILCFIFFKKPDTDQLNFLYFSISYVLFMCILIGLVTPIMGAFVRYKTVALPFLLLIFVSVLDLEKLSNKFPILTWLKDK